MVEVKLSNSYDSDSEADEEFEIIEERLTLQRRDDSDSELDSELDSECEGISSLTYREDSDSDSESN